MLFLLFLSFRLIYISAECDKNTDIGSLGLILCHYSSVNADGGFTGSTWSDISGNENDLTYGVDFTGISYLGSHGGLNEDFVYNDASTGYITFPSECNLAANGDYTLFTASMYYGNAPQNSRAFGNCLDNTFVSGWYQPDFATSATNYQWQLSAKRDNYELHSEYYNINGWAIISDTINSMRLNGREITHEIPVFDKLGNNDVQICFNYVSGQTTAAPLRIKEYIVFDETLDDDIRRCVEEYIFDKHDHWQHLEGLSP